MNNITKKQRNIAYAAMLLLVTIWGLDYIVAKNALEAFDPLTLLFSKYAIGLVFMSCVKFKIDRKSFISRKHIPILIACSVSGEILYFACEYTAMDYLPVSLITIILAFMPVLSMIIERIIYKRKPSVKMILGAIVCIVGIVFIIGIDYEVLFQGRFIGYLLAFGSVFAWNVYNYITASLHDKYSGITLAFSQLLCTIIILSPYAIHNFPPMEVLTPSVIGGVIYLGIFAAGLAFFIQVKCLYTIGPTRVALFSNFMPVTATFFSWWLLGEAVSVLQVVGGIVVIAAGYVVIKEKGRLEEKYHEENIEHDHAH